MTTTDSIPTGAGPTEQGAGGLPAPVVTIEVGPTPIAPPADEAAPDRPPAPPAEPSAEETVIESAAGTAPAEAAPSERAAPRVAPASILAVDVGGTKVKILATGQTE